MAAGVFTVATTKTRTSVNATQVTITITCTTSGDFGAADATVGPVIAPAPIIFAEGFPFGSAQLVVTSGSAPTSARLWVGNDGLLANLVQIGVAHAAFPSIVDLTSGQNASTQTVAETLAAFPTFYHSWTLVAASAPSVITITECYMGTRG